MSIGQRIKEMRIQNGLSIDELACRLGKNRTTVYRYENGDIENLPLGILDSLANALNTSPAYLMGWENSNQNASFIYETSKPLELEYASKWLTEIGANALNDEEYRKVMEYARFLLSIREN